MERQTKVKVVRRDRGERNAEIGELVRRQERIGAYALERSSSTQGCSTNGRNNNNNNNNNNNDNNNNNYYYYYHYHHHHHHQPFSWSVDWAWWTNRKAYQKCRHYFMLFFMWG